MLLNNRDRSTTDTEELFGINLDVDTKVLRQHLAPPGMADERAIPLMECMVDAVSLPGKISQSGESDDLGANIHAALAELITTSNQNGGREDMNRDLKWRNQNRHALKSVRNESQLKEMARDVQEIRDRCLRNLIAKQKTILSVEPWDPYLIEAWSQSGYITVISRRSVDHYISLLNHLVITYTAYGWEETNRIIEFFVKEWGLIRSNSSSRLMAMCHIYVHLRDAADAKWIIPALEAQKVTALFVSLATLIGGGGGGGTGGGGGGGPNGASGAPRQVVCGRCGTMLHGSHPCFVLNGSAAAAKKKGQALLRRLAGEGAEQAEQAEG
ncbi:MAG: hypothetical protein ACRCYW_02375 [Aeromonas sp.]|uniref:hypothetical protein n=1 Tax=Aeromonas sp. TaxID=647 RepID=UPI003F2B8528